MSEKVCCVTGPQNIPANKEEFVKARLREEIEAAIADGYTTFLSGFDEGVDLLFAELVVEQLEQHPNLFLEAAISYRNRVNKKDPLFHKCLAACRGIKIQQEKYIWEALLDRSRYMLSLASRIIAVYDGVDKSNTLFFMNNTRPLGKEIREIHIKRLQLLKLRREHKKQRHRINPMTPNHALKVIFGR